MTAKNTTKPAANTKKREESKKPTRIPQSTVRKGKRNPASSTQRFLPFSEIRNDTVILKNGGLRAVLQVEALNFNLKSETEQQGIIAGYQSFINTLTFPVQVTVRSRRLNIDPYLQQIHTLAKTQENELLKNQTTAYADFVERIVEVADIMQKRFYVIIPLDDEVKRRTLLSKFFSWLKIDDNQSKALQRYKYFHSKAVKLKERITLIESGLTNIGLMTKRLNTQELIELYYQIYNPHTSQEQKLNGDPNVEKMVL